MLAPQYLLEFDAADLLKRYPPKLQHPHKTMLFEWAYPNGKVPQGRIEVTRWLPDACDRIPLRLDQDTVLLPDFYDYAVADKSGAATEWHVNFADPRLFVAYGSRLFAQDEMQVAEHPLLGSVREAMVAEKHSALTAEGGLGTPILVRNVERRLVFDTSPNAVAGRPQGLYGNRFAVAAPDVIRRATSSVEPSGFSNIIAMAAPSGGRGEYKLEEIKYVLETALLGFRAARSRSLSKDAAQNSPTVIHSGYWGCGAFGGHRRLMIALQAIAARGAGVDRLVLHVGDSAGLDEAKRACDLADSVAARFSPECEKKALAEKFAEFGFRWGVSDGN